MNFSHILWYVLFEPGEETITVLSNRSQETYPVALTKEIDRGSRPARKPHGMQLNLHRCLGLVDADYCGVHLSPLF